MTLKSYLQNIYPDNLRTDIDDLASITSYYDDVRSYVLDLSASETKDAADELIISTATEIWISAWEEFLSIPVDPSATLDERRSIVLSQVIWWNTTLSVLKSVIYSMVGWDATSVEIYEKWTDPASTWDEVFEYDVRITDSLVTKSYSPSALQAIIEQMQPAHCTVRVLTDYWPFRWSQWTTPASTDPYNWASEEQIFTAKFWS